MKEKGEEVKKTGMNVERSKVGTKKFRQPKRQSHLSSSSHVSHSRQSVKKSVNNLSIAECVFFITYYVLSFYLVMKDLLEIIPTYHFDNCRDQFVQFGQ